MRIQKKMSDSKKFWWSTFWIGISIVFLLVGAAFSQNIPPKPPMPKSIPIKDNCIVDFEKSHKYYTEKDSVYYLRKVERHINDRKLGELEIIYDDSFESGLLISELSRNWSEYSQELARFDQVKDDLKIANIKQTYYKEHKNGGEYVKFPVYRFSEDGKNAKFKQFPPSTFSCISWPLLTVDVLCNRQSRQYKKWEVKKEIIDDVWQDLTRQYIVEFCEKYNLSRPYIYYGWECPSCGTRSYRECLCGEQFEFYIDSEALWTFGAFLPPVKQYPPKPRMEFPYDN